MSYRFLSQLLVFCLLLFSTACSDQTQQSRDHIPQEVSNKSFDLANAPLVSVQDTDTLSIILARQNAIEIQLKKNENWEEWQNGLWTGLFCLVLLGLCFSLLKLWQLQKANFFLENEKELIAQQAERDIHALKKREKTLDQRLADLELINRMLNIRNQLVKEDETIYQPFLREAEEIHTKNTFDTEGVKFVTNDDWQRFREQFDTAYPNFSLKLKTEFSQLSQSDIRLFLLIKIGMDNVGTANALGISVSSVYTSRYRLRKKLELKEEEDLESFIDAF